MAISVNIYIEEDSDGNLSELEKRVLNALSGGGNSTGSHLTFTAGQASEEKPKAPEAKPAKGKPKAEAVKEEPAKKEEKPEPAKKEELKKEEPKKEEKPTPEVSDEDPLQKAVDVATRLVTQGKTAVVKEALAKAGAKRVSELKGATVQVFLDAVGDE